MTSSSSNLQPLSRMRTTQKDGSNSVEAMVRYPDAKRANKHGKGR